MRVLLIGGSGQLGRALHATFAPDHAVTATAHRHPGPGQATLDLGAPDRVRAALGETRPALVLVAGAMCDVDGCERDTETCRRVNTQGPAVVAEYVRDHGGRVVLFSTDHVFDGTGDRHRETDPVRPLNAYARSKAEAEAALAALLPDRHLVIRTSWLYGPDPERRNFALRCVDCLAAGERIRVPADQWGNPSYTEDVARATRVLVDRGEGGIFHASGPECVDRVTLARQVCARFGLDEEGIVPTPTSALGQAAPRPLRVELDCRKLRAAGAGDFRGVAAGLEALWSWESAPVRS